MQAANADKIDVVVNSGTGGLSKFDDEKDAIENLVNKGVVVVVAAGNQNQDVKNYSPASIPGSDNRFRYC